ncbi:DUF6882 domain-containing protein [Streptomyces sp. NPDC000594]|uniref:DUF6882 domain-containing protein n=1 Tax=Streptomyces sp. NPDC000594 TaxID=3154261 RepID=UPI00332D18CA
MERNKQDEKPHEGDQSADQDDLGTLLLQGEDLIGGLAQAHRTWGLGSAQRWDLDQRTGLISWTFPDRTATAPAQILGSYSPTAGSWLWAWANESILPSLGRDARSLREWGERHGHAAFTEPTLPVDEESVATLTALAVRITRAGGFYRAPAGASVVMVTFGPVTLTAADGTTSAFTVDLSPEDAP